MEEKLARWVTGISSSEDGVCGRRGNMGVLQNYFPFVPFLALSSAFLRLSVSF